MGLDSGSFSTEQGELTLKTQGRVRVDNGEAMRDACVAGLGIAQISRWNAYQHVQRGELLSILTEYPLISQAAIWALYP
ncbi:LysR family transcriptional regulator, partial [Bacillus pacificus]|nr:LysR family transcriptional regulator [Bacillus pacificus]